jgi:hypothetical protein
MEEKAAQIVVENALLKGRRANNEDAVTIRAAIKGDGHISTDGINRSGIASFLLNAGLTGSETVKYLCKFVS